jgi:hypothetical protein
MSLACAFTVPWKPASSPRKNPWNATGDYPRFGQLLAEGKSNKEVASTLGTSVKTVETQRAAIMRKLGFTAFSELVRYAVRNHMVSP